MPKKRKQPNQLPAEAIRRLSLGKVDAASDATLAALDYIWVDFLYAHKATITDVTGKLTGVRYSRFSIPTPSVPVRLLACDKMVWQQVLSLTGEHISETGFEAAVDAVLAGVPAKDIDI